MIRTPALADVAATYEHAIAVADQLAAEDPRVVVLQQFTNPANPEIHYRTTGPEILEQLEGSIDAFVAGVGTGGTITGVGRHLHEQVPACLVVAVEPANAPALTGGPVSFHRQQGIGDGFVPENCDTHEIDRCIVVSDEDALQTCRLLARVEGLAVGISSGSNVWAALQLAAELGEGRKVATVLPDTLERYWSAGV